MISISEWVHQHSFLLLVVAVVSGTAVPLLVRRRSRWLWSAWAGLILAAAGSLIVLRTPAATVSEHLPGESVLSTTGADVGSLLAYRELSLESEHQIEQVLAAGPKPTLVEVYVDYGIG